MIPKMKKDGPQYKRVNDRCAKCLRGGASHTHTKKSGWLTNRLIGSNCVVAFFRKIFLAFLLLPVCRFSLVRDVTQKTYSFSPFQRDDVYTFRYVLIPIFFFYLLPLLTISFYLRLSSSSPPTSAFGQAIVNWILPIRKRLWNRERLATTRR